VSLRVLAIDTTGEHGSLALLEGERIIEETALHSPEGFGHILFSGIQDLLKRHAWSIEDLDGFASASGPGSFTGVRVGLTAVKGLAEATGRRVVAVSNLQAMAWFGTRPLRAPLIDARRGEIYGAVYDATLELVRDEVVVKLPVWLRTLPPGDLELITSGVLVPPETAIPILQAPPILAGAIGAIAVRRFAKSESMDPSEIDANYVRRSDAELLWKDPV